jgi:hypothetical protein
MSAVAGYILQMSKRTQVGFRCSVEPGNANSADGRDCQNRELEAGIENREWPCDEDCQCRERQRIQEIQSPVKQAAEKHAGRHEARAQDWRPVLDDSDIACKSQQCDGCRESQRQPCASSQPVQKNHQCRRVQAGHHEDVIRAAFLKGHCTWSLDEGLVAQQHRAQHCAFLGCVGNE